MNQKTNLDGIIGPPTLQDINKPVIDVPDFIKAVIKTEEHKRQLVDFIQQIIAADRAAWLASRPK